MNSILRTVGVVAAFGLVAVAFRGVDLGGTVHLMSGLGPVLLLLLLPYLPYAAAIALEVFAWRRAFFALDARPRFWSLFRVRVASESLSPILPFGALWAETLKPVLLVRDAGCSLSTSMAGIAARKYVLLAAQVGYLLAGCWLGHRVLAEGFGRAIGLPALAYFPLGAALVLFVASEAMALAFAGGGTFRAIHTALARVPVRAWRAFLARWNDDVVSMDGAAASFFGKPLAMRLWLAAPCLLQWLLEASETWLILTVLGKHLNWGDAVAIESVVVLARHLLVLLPGGLGAQELGYAAFLGGDAHALAICAAFVLAKRLRELCWVVIGYALLHLGARPATTRTPALWTQTEPNPTASRPLVAG
ncbi:MAG TPA: lysylphosphatidylglycerol synthase domain-containing protein [Polyangiaceae bacterium]|nr:lysylphosphatidylglycerol synthase domain-containing protein [Polyangiaceae bacterium]